MKSIIFDLDLTLVDTTCLEYARHTGNWKLAYSLIPQTTLYEGLKEVFDIIRENNIKTAIVSTSPRPYVEKLVAYHNIPSQYIVGYHDAKPIKPHPAQMIKAIDLMNEDASNVVSFGDRAIDIKASNAANIESVACLWGTKEKSDLLNSSYRHVITNPNEILTLLI
jgi:phosphoglycolate phosphatase-like HAD superfamily hydrolase